MAPVKNKKSLNPSETDYRRRFNGIARAEELAGLNKSFDLPAISSEDRNTNPLSALKNSEQDAGKWNLDLASQATKLVLKVPRIKKSGVAWLVGGGAGVLGLVLTFVALLIPMKLQAMMSNVMASASQVPQHAIEQRVEYLVTRALASRMLAMSSGVDAKLIFCKGGGIACSLIKTYTADYYEKKLGIKLDGVEASGRTSLGGNAKSWSIAVDTNDPNSPNYIKPGVLNGQINFDEAEIEKARTRITSNSEMKALIKKEVNSKTRWYNVNRYLVRKILMQKYGVRAFSGPKKVEAALNKISEARSTLKARVIKNTVGKISLRMATYMTCLSDAQTCDKLRDSIKADLAATDPKNTPGYEDLGDDEKLRLDTEFETKTKFVGAVEEIAKAEGPLSKLLSKSMMKTLGIAGAIVGAADLIYGAVEAIDEGALERISYDISTQAYTGFSTEIGVIIQKAMAGDMDLETLQAATELFEGAEKSALYMAETTPSQYNERVSSSASGFSAECKGAGDELVNTTLERGELVCPEQRVVRNYAAEFADNPVWSKFADVARIYNHYWVGAGTRWVGDKLGDLIAQIPGYQTAMDAAMGVAGAPMQDVLSWFTSLAFDIPDLGPTASGANNYVAYNGGVRVSQNALMEEGVDSDGNAMGGAGTILSNQQVAEITEAMRDEQNQEFNSRSIAEKMFDNNNSQSFVSRFVAQIPISWSGVASLPISSLLSALTVSPVRAAPLATNVNPFHIPIYGYTLNADVLKENPDAYTPELCAISAQKRLDSYERREGDLIPVYHESDPCALEKLVIGSELAEQGIEGDEYSFQSIQDIPVAPIDGEAVVPTEQDAIVTGDLSQDSTNVSCAAGSEDVGNVDGYRNGVKIKIKLCAIPGTKSTSSEDSKYGRRIVVNSRVSGPFTVMVNRMRAELGMAEVNFTSSFRSNSTQASLYALYKSGQGNLAARPGYSPHQLGTAVDFKLAPDIANSSSNCRGTTRANVCKPPKQSVVHTWLSTNASRYGISQLYNEYWHWEHL